MSVGVNNGFYRLAGLLSQKFFQPFCSFVRIQAVDEDQGGVSLDGNGVAVSQADNAADPAAGLENTVWICSFCVMSQTFFTCHGVPPVICFYKLCAAGRKRPAAANGTAFILLKKAEAVK